MGVDSTVGVGSTFVLELPFGVELDCKDDASDSSVSSVTLKQTLSNAVVLYADDNQINLRLMNRHLKGYINELITAKDGKEAFDRVMSLRNSNDSKEEMPLFLILLDINMPVWTGIDAARALRKENVDIPVCAVTANITDLQNEVESMDIKLFDDVLKK